MTFGGFCPGATKSRFNFVARSSVLAPEPMRKLHTSLNAVATTAAFNITIISRFNQRWRVAKIAPGGQ
jgi:hypothetical protein